MAEEANTRKSFEFSEREIEEDIRAQVSRAFHEARWIIAQLILPGTEIKAPTIEQSSTSPLADQMRKVFEHAAGTCEVPNIQGLCHQLLRLLYGKAPSHGDAIPTVFWTTPLGAAIRECSGSFVGLSDETELSEPEAARFLGVSQLTVLSYCQCGDLRVHRQIGPRRLFTLGELKAFRRSRWSDEARSMSAEG
ncbi:MAG TPA: helix-turn-helix domain-containing protein [Blastocatellia bacterium]|nr:helix-turn-helix domain-containing protein [Blastocatellia bacterium]